MASSAPRGSQLKPGSITNTEIAAAAAIATSKLADGANFILKNGSVAFTGAVDFGNQRGIEAGDPINPQDVATRNWVLTQIGGIGTKAVTTRVATTGNITLSGTQTVDEIALSADQTCLVKDQTTQSQNGPYIVKAGAWVRMTAIDAWDEVPGMLVSVEEGEVNSDTLWLSTADLGGTLNTTAITFTQLPGPSDILPGLGLTRSGQTINVGATDDSILVGVDSLAVQLHSSGALSTVALNGIAVLSDNTTIDISGNALRVKPGGVGETQLGANVYQRTARIVIREVPVGAINGSNTTFTLAQTPVAGSEEVYLNGILQQSGAGNDYTVSGATLTYLSPPLTEDLILVNYRW